MSEMHLIFTDILSLSDAFDDHSALKHKESDNKDHSLKGRIMSNVVYAPKQ
jgi:hypothetical protein